MSKNPLLIVFAITLIMVLVARIVGSYSPQSPQPTEHQITQDARTHKISTSNFVLQRYADYCNDSAEKKNNHWLHYTACEKSVEVVIALFTVILALATIGLICVGILQGRQLKRTVDSARDSEAPYLFPEITGAMNFDPVPGHEPGRPHFAYGFRNRGKTPAIIRRFRDYNLFTDQFPTAPTFLEPWERRPQVYLPVAQGEMGGHLNSIPQNITAEEFLRRLGRDGMVFYIVGEVEYENIFGDVHIQRYCLSIRGLPEVGGRRGIMAIRAGGRAYNERK